MRLFIAIELPATFKKELFRIERELKQVSCGGRFVPQENFHITLQFLGDCDDLREIVSAMHEAVRGIRQFTLHLGKYNYFDKGGRKTSFVEVKGEINELNALHDSLEAALFNIGFARDHKKFNPHITLGRNVEHDELAGAELKAISPNASMMVQGITLYESTRVDGKAAYVALHKERF